MAHDQGLMPCKLEVCVASLEDAITAAQCGAARIELNSALELGGLTPSIGLTERVVQELKYTGCEVIAMVRPRPGGFVYGQRELEVMRREIDHLIGIGVDGVAFGVLREDRQVDERANRALLEPIHEAKRQAVFHRAFDLATEMPEALDKLIEMGFDRVLTSGGASDALEGAGVIRSLIERAGDQIEVLPGGGVRSTNVDELRRTTGCTQVHASLRLLVQDRSISAKPAVRFNTQALEEGAYHRTDEHKVAKMLKALGNGQD